MSAEEGTCEQLKVFNGRHYFDEKGNIYFEEEDDDDNDADESEITYMGS